MEHKNAFMVSLVTDKPISATYAAELIRKALHEQKNCASVDSKREATTVVKVADVPMGEKIFNKLMAEKLTLFNTADNVDYITVTKPPIYKTIENAEKTI